MSTTFAPHPAFVAATAVRSIVFPWQSLLRLLTIRRAQRHLSELPDYLLKDVGIGRSEIFPAVRNGRG